MHENIQFDIASLRQTRKLIYGLAASLSTEQLNTIPENFRNNVAWHLGHVIAVQQALCYTVSGIPVTVSQDIMTRFPKDSFPDGVLSEAYIAELKSLSIKTVDELVEDYTAGKFANYRPYETSFGYRMETIEEAIRFLPVHEGIHLGYVMALRRCLG